MATDFRMVQLRFASIGGNEELVESLFDSLACDKLLTDETFLNKDSPLVLAVLANHVGTARLLLSKTLAFLETTKTSIVINYKIPTAHNNMTCLEWACQRGHLELANLFVEFGAMLQLKSKKKDSVNNAFTLAFDNDHLEICDMLLEKFTTKVVKKELSTTAFFHDACKAGKLASITYLIEKEVVSIESFFRKLHFPEEERNLNAVNIAVKYNNMEVCTYLLLTVSRSNNATQNDLLRALVLACQHNCLEVFNEVLPKIAQSFVLSTKRNGAMSPLHAACLHDNIDFVQRMLDRGTPIGLSNLCAAVEGGNIVILDLLLRNGGKMRLEKLPTVVVTCPNNPMRAVALNGRIDMAQIIIQAGGNKLCFAMSGSLEENDFRTPLSYACEQGHYAIAKLLLSASLEDIDFIPFRMEQFFSSAGVKMYLSLMAETGMSMMLHISNRYIEYQQIDELVAWLDEKEVQSTLANSIMFLQTNAAEKRIENLRMYLQQGLSYGCLLKAYSSNQQFLTAKELFGESNIDFIHTLLEMGLIPDAEVNRLLLSACTIRKFEVARYLLDCGAQFTLCPELNTAIRDGGDATIDLLLDTGFDVNSVDSINPFPIGGNTLLKWVCLARLLPSAKRLFAAGANVNYQDELGRTALDWLATSAHLDDAENDLQKMDLITLLLENGADQELCDNSGFSAKTLLEKHGYVALKVETGDGDVLTGMKGLSVSEAKEAEEMPRRKVNAKRRSTTNLDIGR